MASIGWVIIDGVFTFNGATSFSGNVTVSGTNKILFTNAGSSSVGPNTTAGVQITSADGGAYFIVNNGLVIVNSSTLRFSNAGTTRYNISAPAADQILLQNSGATGSGTIMLGGTSASFPALVANGANLQVQKADLSAFCPVVTNAIAMRTAAGGAAGWWGLNPADAQFLVQNNATTAGVTLDVTTDNVLKITSRTQADTSVLSCNQFKTTAALITSTAATTPTFGTNFVGGAGGPTTGAQNAWVKMLDSSGATIWIPVWK